MLAVNLACAGLSSPPTATPTAAPTNTPQPTNTALPAVVPDNSIKHKSGAFEYTAPVGWDVNEYAYSVFMSPGDNPEDRMKVTFSLAVENTGIELDSEAFKGYVAATEAIWYDSQKNYSLISMRDEEPNVIAVKKSFTDSNGDQVAYSSYNQAGAFIYTVGIYAKAELFDEYIDLFISFASTLRPTPDNLSDVPLYYSTWAYEAPNQAYTMDVPVSWIYLSADVSGTTYSNAVVDVYIAPDASGLVEFVYLKKSSAYTMNTAAGLVLEILNDRYGLGGVITVDGKQTLQDGSEYWDWSSGNLIGDTSFEIRDGGRTILFFTFMALAENTELLDPLFLTMIGTYAIP